MELRISAHDKRKGETAMPTWDTDPRRLRVRVESQGSAVVLFLAGDLDFRTADLLRQAVDIRLMTGRAQLVVDCTELAFCDSSGLGVLVGAAKRAAARDGRVTLRAVPAYLRQILEVTGLVKVLRIES